MLFSDCVLASPIVDNNKKKQEIEKEGENMNYDTDVDELLLMQDKLSSSSTTTATNNNTASLSSSAITRERKNNHQRYQQDEENENSLTHKLKLLSSRATQGNIIKEDDEEDMPLTLLDDNSDSDNMVRSISDNLDAYPSTALAASATTAAEESLLDFVEDDYKNSLRMKSVSIDDDEEEEDDDDDDESQAEEAEDNSKPMGIMSRESNDNNDIKTEEGGFFSTVTSTESPFLKDGILPKPDQHRNFTRQQEEEKLRRQKQNEGLKKAFSNTWNFTQNAAQAVGRTTTNVFQGTVDFLLEPIPEEVGYRNVTHGEEDLYEVNKFTRFEENLDRFLDDVLDGPEGESNLGWYRKVQINDDDSDDEYYPKKSSSTTTTTTTTLSDPKPFSDSKTTLSWEPASTTISTNSNDGSCKKINDKKSSSSQDERAMSDLNPDKIPIYRDLLDEVHSLKIELQKSKCEKESLEEELLSCFEQKENLSSLVHRLRDDADLLQLHSKSDQQQEELLLLKEENNEKGHEEQLLEKKKDTIKQNNNDNNNNKEERKQGSTPPGNDTSWEDKVTLWKKILKGIEMDMIISSKKKACNKEIHLKFINEVENNARQWNTLLSTFFFSTSNNITAAYTFRNEKKNNNNMIKEDVHEEEIVFSKHIDDNVNNDTASPKSNENKIEENNLLDINADAEVYIPPVPTAPPPPPPPLDEEEDDASPVIVQFDNNNLFGGTANVAVDLIGLDDTTVYDNNTTASTTIHFGSSNVLPVTNNTSQTHNILPPDLFTEQPISVDDNAHNNNNSHYNNTAPMGTSTIPFPEAEKDTTLVDFNYNSNNDNQQNNSIAADFMNLVPPPLEAPPPPPSPPEVEEIGKDDTLKEEEMNDDKSNDNINNNRNRFGFFRLFTKRNINNDEKEEEEEKEITSPKTKEEEINKNNDDEEKKEEVVLGGFSRLFTRKNMHQNKEKEEETAKANEEEEKANIKECEEEEQERVEEVSITSIIPEDPNKECMYKEIYSYLHDIPLNIIATSLEQEEKSNIDTKSSFINDNHNLSSDSIMRYSRQLLLNDGFGVNGQEKLSQAKVLVVGAGGIGSTVLLYLAASGISNITIVDSDNVEMTNLHRQVIHTEDRIGMNKAISARLSLLALNPKINVKDVSTSFNHLNAIELCSTHDVVVDATDNPRTRYMINDACILSSKCNVDNNNCKTPLVSGSAMGTEGQITVYNYDEDNCTGCYRCLYPNVDKREGCKSCSDNGVLGPVPGMIGLLQSLEVIKIITGIGEVLNKKLLMYDSLACSFYKIQKPKPLTRCELCGEDPIITTMLQSFLTLKSARGPSSLPCANSSLLPPEHNVSCRDYYDQCVRTKRPHLLLDVRVKKQYEMCHLPNSKNIPLEELQHIQSIDDIFKKDDNVNDDEDHNMFHTNKPIYCICRRGIASVDAVNMLLGKNANDEKFIYNIDGGLSSWTEEVDPSFPRY